MALALQSVLVGGLEGEAEVLRLETSAGSIHARYHDAEAGDLAVVWVGGAGGGFGGPAGGLYPRLAERLACEGVASLRLHYRRPAEFEPCVLDVLTAIVYLATRARSRAILVGYSFGGAVVIAAGARSPAVVGVAALSSQTAGADDVGLVSPRPLLLIHGSADGVLSDRCSRELYRRAGEPRRLRLYPGCGHGLDACREAVEGELMAWIREVAARERPVVSVAGYH